MPSRNVLKIDTPDTYYHLYGRGKSKKAIFLDEIDYRYFLRLIARYLSKSATKDQNNLPYPNFYDRLELLAFCLMPNHFHLLVYQIEEKSMSSLMQGLLGSYSRYFNAKYEQSGALLESRYKASMVTTDSYAQHISRYIHLNPYNWQTAQYSSIKFYLGKREEEWLRPERILELFDGREDYLAFLKSYEEHKAMLDHIKRELKNNIRQ